MRLVAQDIRTEYVRGRRAWESNKGVVIVKPYIPGQRLDSPVYDSNDELLTESLWVRAAKFLLGAGFDPLACVNSMFTDAFNSSRTPWPESLISPCSSRIFEIATEESRRQLPAAFAFQQQLCRRTTCLIREDEELAGAALFSRVLLDDTNGLSPLFRYCLARSVGLNVASDRFFKAALLQYLVHTDTYDKVWDNWVPQSLRDIGVQARLILKGFQNGGKAARETGDDEG